MHIIFEIFEHGDYMFITVIRTVFLYITVIFAIRLMGKRQIGDLQPSELVITILISEIAAIPIQDLNQPVLTGVVAVLTLAFLEIAVSVIAMKSISLRRLLYGDSAIIVKNGEIDQKMLKKLRVTGPDLLEVLRNQEIFDIKEVLYAILETNGQISVMLKPEYMPVTNGNEKQTSLPCLVISDGKILKNAVKSLNLSNAEIKARVAKSGLNIKDVFIMTLDSENSMSIIKRKD